MNFSLFIGFLWFSSITKKNMVPSQDYGGTEILTLIILGKFLWHWGDYNAGGSLKTFYRHIKSWLFNLLTITIVYSSAKFYKVSLQTCHGNQKYSNLKSEGDRVMGEQSTIMRLPSTLIATMKNFILKNIWISQIEVSNSPSNDSHD